MPDSTIRPHEGEPVSPTYMPYLAIARRIVFFQSGTLSALICAGERSRKKRWPSAGALAVPEQPEPRPWAG